MTVEQLQKFVGENGLVSPTALRQKYSPTPDGSFEPDENGEWVIFQVEYSTKKKWPEVTFSRGVTETRGFL